MALVAATVLVLRVNEARYGQSRVSDLVTDVRGGRQIEVEIHPSLPRYVFRLVGDRQNNIVQSIEVRQAGKSTVLQTLQSRMDEPPYRNAQYFRAEDLNFDGYRDLRLLIAWGATGNETYDAWLFNPKTGLFDFHAEFADLTDPTPDPLAKEIRSFAVAGMAGAIYVKGTYRWEDGRLTLVREERQDWISEKGYFVKVIRARRDGQLQEISRDIVRP